jgi:hypothetical protein
MPLGKPDIMTDYLSVHLRFWVKNQQPPRHFFGAGDIHYIWYCPNYEYPREGY